MIDTVKLTIVLGYRHGDFKVTTTDDQGAIRLVGVTNDPLHLASLLYDGIDTLFPLALELQSRCDNDAVVRKESAPHNG